MNHRTYLALAIPLTISTMTPPLLGAVDTAVVGQLPNPAYIGGVVVGTMIFNTMYWLFGFLQVSTSGFAAQANGANNDLQRISIQILIEVPKINKANTACSIFVFTFCPAFAPKGEASKLATIIIAAGP